jgi:hypothetical protein
VSKDDPAQQGNRVPTLLSSDTPGTTTLALGLTLTPPLPRISRDRIPKFNVVRDFRQTVNCAGYPFPGDGHAQAAWQPKPQAGDWKAFKRQYMSTDPQRPRDVVKQWAQRLNYADDVMTGSRPTSLLWRFDDVVPALPMIAVGF